MCLVFYTSTRVTFICPHVSSTLLPTLHYFTLSLNGSPPPDDDDDADDADDKQGKTCYLIHIWQRNCRKEYKKKARSKARSPKIKARKEKKFSFAIFVF